jgi:hypothetical protein
MSLGCRGDVADRRQLAPEQSAVAVDTHSAATDPAAVLASVPLSPPGKRPDDVPLFERLSADRTGVEFQLRIPDVESHVREVIHLNVNGGICTGDYDGDGLTDFYVTSAEGGNRLYRNLGDFRFRDVTLEVGLDDRWFWGTGATFVDIDDDGDLDIYACGYRRSNRLFINEQSADGNVRFIDRAEDWGLAFNGASMTMAFADLENDGDLDGYLATTALAPPSGVEFKVRFEGNKPVVIDSLREYWELIYLPGDRAHRTEAGQFDRLFRNDGQHFTEVTKQAGIDGPYFTLSASWWDYNEDGFPDLYAANDFLGPDRLYHNNGDGTFTDVAKDLLPHTPWFSMGTDLADVNNDGLIDFLATDMSARSHHRHQVMRGNLAESDWFLELANPRQYVRNALYLNSGAGRMIEAAYQTDLASTDWTWNPRWADFDNDGRVDLFITTGVVRDTMNSDLGNYADTHFAPGSVEWAQYWAKQAMHKEANVAMRNLGNLKFDDAGDAWGLSRIGVSFGAATADFDNDGDLDLVVNDADVPVSIYRNLSDGGHRVRIRLSGRASNRYGIGAKIELMAGGLRQASYVTLARGWLSAVEPITTFGLGKATKIDELTVIWPSGHRQKFADLAVDQLYTITEPQERPKSRRAASPVDNDTHSPQPQQHSDRMFIADAQFPKIDYAEAAFNDFELQPLLPYKLSEPGPAMAWADVNNDGRDDFYVGGPKGQPGRLFMHREQGEFMVRPTAAFDEDRESEDTNAEFFDADRDGDLDLYVVSGSIEHEAGHTAYRDRLYLNDGKGEFTESDDGALPDLRDSGSVARACDFDQDGDVDLFVGSRCVPGEYPLSPASRLLIQQDGRFHEETPKEIGQAGMVTDAAWADVDGDGWFDLIVTIDWGPVRLFANRRGRLVEQTADAGLSDRRGCWRAIAVGDFDGDSDTDIVVTNLGLNTPYRASPESPARLLYGDFDGSGRSHLLEAKREGSLWYPRRDRAALASAMPVLTENYDTFDAFGRATLADIITEERLQQAKRWEINTLQSGVLLNEGRFRFEPLPALAQVAPSLGVDVGDVNGDTFLDIVLAQNFYDPHPVTGRMDGGVSVLLLGTGKGTFEAVWPDRSGIVVPADARKVKIVELDGDGRPDLVFAVQNGRWRALRSTFAGPQTTSVQAATGR